MLAIFISGEGIDGDIRGGGQCADTKLHRRSSIQQQVRRAILAQTMIIDTGNALVVGQKLKFLCEIARWCAAEALIVRQKGGDRW